MNANTAPLPPVHASRAAYLATRSKALLQPPELDHLRELRPFVDGTHGSNIGGTPDPHLVVLIDDLLTP